jgi:hypothetical protein
MSTRKRKATVIYDPSSTEPTAPSSSVGEEQQAVATNPQPKKKKRRKKEALTDPKHKFSVQQLGGSCFDVMLHTPRVTQLLEAGIATYRQELFKVAVASNGGVVREDDAEPILLADEDELMKGEQVTLSVCDVLSWETCGRSVSISDDGFTATKTMANYSKTMVQSQEVSEGRHFIEVKILRDTGRGGLGTSSFTWIGVAKSEADVNDFTCGGAPIPWTELHRDQCWFINTYHGALWGGTHATEQHDRCLNTYHGAPPIPCGHCGVGGAPAGRMKKSDRVGVLLDLEDGSIAFFKNGVKHGTGFPAGSVTGPAVFAASMCYDKTALRLLPAAVTPAV